MQKALLLLKTKSHQNETEILKFSLLIFRSSFISKINYNLETLSKTLVYFKKINKLQMYNS